MKNPAQSKGILKIAAAACIALGMLAGNAQGEIVQLQGLNGKVVVDSTTPARGTHKKSVLKKYGQPGKRGTTVGKPPITAWQYPGFTVYFENHHVIHSVKH